MQKIVYTTLPQDTITTVTFDKLHLFLPKFMPRPNTQFLFNESIKKSFPLPFDSWTTDRQVISAGSEDQLDIGSSVEVNCPKYLIAANQTAARYGFANKAINVSVFDHVDVRKCFV